MPEQRHLPVGVYKRTMFMCVCIHRPRLPIDGEKGSTCVIEMNFWFYRRGLFLQKVQDSESVVLMTLTEYDPQWLKRRMGAQVQFSRSFSQLWSGVLFTAKQQQQQQRIQATFLKFWMSLSLFQRPSRLFEVEDSPQARHSVPEKVGENFSSPQPLVLLLTCFFTRQCRQIAKHIISAASPFCNLCFSVSWPEVYWLYFTHQRVWNKYPQVQQWKRHMFKYRRIIQVHL